MTSIANAVKNLVDRFKSDETRFIASASTYQETEVRVEFIDPLFTLLGWQMNNAAGLPSALRDVLREESHQTESATKKPDYTFRIAAIRKFFVEAKRPSVDIRVNKDSAFQVRSYGYTAGHHIAVLTNFRTLRVYDVRLEPKVTDDADVGLLMSIDYVDFVAKIDEIKAAIGRDEVARGSIESVFKTKSTGSIPANTSFLNRINSWRIRIAQDLSSRYHALTIEELSDFTQKIINRIIFIRMCEDRGIEGEYVLRDVANKKSMVELRMLFKRLDDRYNTGLFDVKKDRLQDTYEIDATVFLGIVDEVYAPNSPYSFSVLDADFLGQVYELFLGDWLVLDSTGVIKLEPKPAYVHREIVTTPQPLVDEVVRRVFHTRLSDMESQGTLSASAIKSMKVLDVAVGSSRFLLQAFDEMIEAMITVLLEQKDERLLYHVTDNNYKLAFTEKRELLKNCLFGCDIDYNAVEIARFSLMVRLLEDETKDTLPPMNQKKILPDLDHNILHGNTVVDASNFPFTSGVPFEKTLPLNWSTSTLPSHFDIVLGNPPYVKTEEMLSENIDEMQYYKKYYKTTYKQFDKYFVFIERALSKMNIGASLGMVVPNKWITIGAGKKLREIFARNDLISQIVDFGNEKLFEGKSAYVCLLILSKSNTASTDFRYRHLNDYHDFLLNPHDRGFRLPKALIKSADGNSWILPNDANEANVLAKLTANSVPLSSIVKVKTGIQTSANDVYLIKNFKIVGDFVDFKNEGVSWRIEKAITRPYVEDSNHITSYSPVVANALMIFPYISDLGTVKIIEPAQMLSDFPMAKAYLDAHRVRLSKRSVSPPPKAGVFYAYGRHQSLNAVFTSPKILFPVNQKGDKYGIDTIGVAYASGGTAGEVAIYGPKDGYALEYFLGLMNHRAIEFFVRKRGSPFGGGWYARGNAVVEDVPAPYLNVLGNPTDKIIHDEIVQDVKDLMQTLEDLKLASGRSIEALNTKRNGLLASIEARFNAIWEFTTEVNELVLPGE